MDFSNLLEALQNPGISPEKPEKVELLQTHVSAIFIVGEHVEANDPSDGRWKLFLEQKKIFEKIQGWDPDLHLSLNTRFPLEECLQTIFRHLLPREARAEDKGKKEVGR